MFKSFLHICTIFPNPTLRSWEGTFQSDKDTDRVMADDGASAVVADGYWCATLGGPGVKWKHHSFHCLRNKGTAWKNVLLLVDDGWCHHVPFTSGILRVCQESTLLETSLMRKNMLAVSNCFFFVPDLGWTPVGIWDRSSTNQMILLDLFLVCIELFWSLSHIAQEFPDISLIYHDISTIHILYVSSNISHLYPHHFPSI